MSMSVSGIHGHLLEVTVVGCTKLKDTEWFSRQDPYVVVEYGSNKNRTRTCTDGGRNPTFQEKFVFSLIEGLRELNVVVWNSNTLTFDDLIGSGKVQLQKALSEGYDDSSWTLQSKTGRYSGEVRLIMHYANARKPASSYAPSAPPYVAPPVSHASYSMPPAAPAPPPLSAAGYPAPAPAAHYPAPSPYPSYPSASTAYPAPSYPPSQPSAYPPSQPSAYPPSQPSAYHPSQPSAYAPSQPSAYPPSQPSAYPPPAYPPASVYPSTAYPPPPQQASPYHPPGHYPGVYPPPPY